MRLYTVYYITANCPTCFGGIPSPIIRSTCKLLITASGTGRSDSPKVEEGSKYGSTSARIFNYSLHVLLMMGEGNPRNT